MSGALLVEFISEGLDLSPRGWEVVWVEPLEECPVILIQLFVDAKTSFGDGRTDLLLLQLSEGVLGMSGALARSAHSREGCGSFIMFKVTWEASLLAKSVARGTLLSIRLVSCAAVT